MARRFRNACGPWIREKRNERGLTQDQLAARLVMLGLPDMDQMVIAKIEGQHRSLFDYELLVFAKVLQCSVLDLSPDDGLLKKELSDLVEGEKED